MTFAERILLYEFLDDLDEIPAQTLEDASICRNKSPSWPGAAMSRCVSGTLTRLAGLLRAVGGQRLRNGSDWQGSNTMRSKLGRHYHPPLRGAISASSCSRISECESPLGGRATLDSPANVSSSFWLRHDKERGATMAGGRTRGGSLAGCKRAAPEPRRPFDDSELLDTRLLERLPMVGGAPIRSRRKLAALRTIMARPSGTRRDRESGAFSGPRT